MTLELQLINDESISVGDLKKFLSAIPDNFELVAGGLQIKKLSIRTDKELETCVIALRN